MRTMVMLIVLGLMLSGCGGAAPVAEDSVPNADAGSGTDQPDNGDTGGQETLADFFGFGGTPEEQEARFREQEERTQELVRQCMAVQGFEYIPMDTTSFVVFDADDRSEEERIRAEGFGITTWVGREDQFIDQGEAFTDPNQEIVEAMSESERDAYYEALYGNFEDQEPTIDPETGEEYYEGFGGGCYGEANEEIYGSQSSQGLWWEELGPEFEAMNERVQADPRIVELNRAWSACMSEAGFEFADQEDMYMTVFDDFQQRLDAIVGPDGGFVDPFEGWTEEEIQQFFEEKSEEEIDAFFEQAQSAEPDYDQEALAALQQEEIDLAVADFECRGDYYDTYQEVSAEYEAEFIAANREKLEELRDLQNG